MNLIKVKAVQDMDCHWYVMPEELYNEFNDMNWLDEEDFVQVSSEFEDKFSIYRTGWDLNNIQLYADLDNNN